MKKDEIQAQTSYHEVSKINKAQVESFKTHKAGKYQWVANNSTVFSFNTKDKMKNFIKEYESKFTSSVR